MIAYHCNRDGCDSWAQQGSNAAAEFLSINDLGTMMPFAHFCCLDCVTVWAAAHSEPTEVLA